MHTDDEFVRRAILAGAAGYLVKTADRSELEAALWAIARGSTWLSPDPCSRRSRRAAPRSLPSDG